MLQLPNSIGPCIYDDAWMSKSFADLFSWKVSQNNLPKKRTSSWDKSDFSEIQQENVILTT